MRPITIESETKGMPFSKFLNDDDQISRQAAMSELDRLPTFVDNAGEPFISKTFAKIGIDLLPSAQPNIIKCKDCGYAEERGCALFCGFWTRYTAHKGYCFKAERREE